MSHISTVDTQITDLDALEAACKELGLELRREQKQHKTYGDQKNQCDAAIILPGNARAYEIGLVLGEDGKTYEIKHDEWQGAGGMVQAAGRGAKKLLVEYGRARTKQIAQQKGWSYREERVGNGYRCYVAPKAKAYAGKKSW